MIKMDSLDFLILSELLKDATLSLVEVAKKVGTSPYTVRRRFAIMKKEGIIVRSIVSIDLTKLGYQGKAFLLITCVSERRQISGNILPEESAEHYCGYGVGWALRYSRDRPHHGLKQHSDTSRRSKAGT